MWRKTERPTPITHTHTQVRSHLHLSQLSSREFTLYGFTANTNWKWDRFTVYITKIKEITTTVTRTHSKTHAFEQLLSLIAFLLATQGSDILHSLTREKEAGNPLFCEQKMFHTSKQLWWSVARPLTKVECFCLIIVTCRFWSFFCCSKQKSTTLMVPPCLTSWKEGWSSQPKFMALVFSWMCNHHPAKIKWLSSLQKKKKKKITYPHKFKHHNRQKSIRAEQLHRQKHAFLRGDILQGQFLLSRKSKNSHRNFGKRDSTSHTHSSFWNCYAQPIWLPAYLFAFFAFLVWFLQYLYSPVGQHGQHLVQWVHSSTLHPLGDGEPGVLEAQLLKDVVHADWVDPLSGPGNQPVEWATKFAWDRRKISFHASWKWEATFRKCLFFTYG